MSQIEQFIKAEGERVNKTNYLYKVYLAGRSGTGKTQGTMSLPGRKLLIDIDNRAEAFRDWPGVKIIECHDPDPKSPKAWDKLRKVQAGIIKDIKNDDFPFETIIYDGLTMMGRIAMNWALLLDSKRGLGGSPAKQHYGPQMDTLSRFVISSLTLPRHICYTGHVELHEDQDGGPALFYPKITGKLRTELPNWFNESYMCYRNEDKEGKMVYKWLTKGGGKYEFFKSSLNTLGKFWEDPVVIDFDKKIVGFEDLLERRFGKEEKKK